MNIAVSLLGTTLGTYELQSVIGSGGMATVYRGFDHNLQRLVAVKILTDAAAAEPGLVARFQQEARFVARLRHPHIVHVYDYGQAGGLAYMVQELLPGPTLEAELLQHAAHTMLMPREDVLEVIRQIGDALDAAHNAGIIHRDVKPSNVMKNAQNQWVLTDFGIARGVQPGTAHTQAGMIIGTPDYLSPEQAQGREPTPASDVYALGVVLFQLLSGILPFNANTPIGVLLGHIQQAPPLIRKLRPDLLPAVEAVVQQALAKEPAQRFTRAGELAQALDQAWPAGRTAAPIHTAPTVAWAAPQQAAPRVPAIPMVRQVSTQVGSATPIVAPPPHGRRGAFLPVLGLAFLVVLLVGGWMLTRTNPDRTTSSLPAAAPTNLAGGLASTAAPAPTAALAPTAAPAPVAPAPVAPVAQLRALFDQAAANEQLGDAKALRKQLTALEQALATGDTAEAAAQLSKLRATLQDAKDLAPDLRTQSLSLLDQIVQQFGLAQPQAAPDENGNGKGNGKGKGKEK